MASNSYRKSNVILPEDHKAHEDRFDDLMADDLNEADEEVKVPDEDTQDDVHLVTIREEPVADTFFDEKHVKQETFGEIKGMDLVSKEEEDEGVPSPDSEAAYHTSNAAQLSNIAKTWGKTVTDEPGVPEEDKKSSEVTVEQVEMGSSPLGTVESEPEQESSLQSEQKLRKSKVTISTPDEQQDTSIGHGSHQTDSKTSSLIGDPNRQSDVETPSVQISHPSADNEIKYEIRQPRQSIYYDMSGRMESSDQDLAQFFDLNKMDDFVLIDEFAEAAEEESVPSAVEEEEEALDRVPYYEKYMKIGDELTENRIRNNLLQKMVIMYLKRRKVENYLKDVEPPLDQVLKYAKKLDAYQELMEINETERKAASSDVSALRRKRNEKDVELNKLFKALQSREGIIGYGLIYAKTGNQIPNKLVERFIRRQFVQSDQVATMRLKSLKLKGMVQEKLNAIDQLDNLENNLHLADYEQLKVENRSYLDKIEERDEELTRLREKCQNTIQVLAHMREKTSALDTDICDLQDDFGSVDGTSKDLRENLAYLKQSRDKFRQMARKIKDESGLLVKPELLIDMETSQQEFAFLEREIAKCKEDVADKTEAVRKLRKNIENLTEANIKKKAAKLLKKSSKLELKKKIKKDLPEDNKSTMNNFYNRRPFLYEPIIKQTAFDDLVKIKPSARGPSKKTR